MPLGFERLNERSQRPNANINFIKPLPSASPRDQKIAQDFLERIAAQCYPVMRQDYVSVMALEEYPPNPEFLGRNFNAGEVIQLVLKDRAGRWLSFKFVQLVMMHELAHCKQMNHSKFFWQVRNRYADQMKELWTKKYEGEGLWGRGQDLTSGVFVHDRMPEGDEVPEHLCGGTYRRAKGRKRKREQHVGADDKAKVSYAERQQKRIAKKFGVHGEGQGLGEDELVRGALEQGKRHYAKPKVAGSKRGRELRANAALARFGAAKNEQQRERKETPELDDDGSETESDDEEWTKRLRVLEEPGSTVQDKDGKDMYQVCGDENEDGEGGKDEFEELRQVGHKQRSSWKKQRPSARPREDSETAGEAEEGDTMHATNDSVAADSSRAAAGTARDQQVPPHEDSETESGAEGPSPPTLETATTTPPPTHGTEHPLAPPPEPLTSPRTTCPICSLTNAPTAPTCAACAHVLRPHLVPHAWRCAGEACRGTRYLNAGDAGRCGLCGGQKPAGTTKTAAGGVGAIGTTGAEVLRWD